MTRDNELEKAFEQEFPNGAIIVSRENKPCPVCGDPQNHCYPCPKCGNTVSPKNEMFGICTACYNSLTERDAYELERQFYMGDLYYPPWEEYNDE